jgi:hypothetical protein
MEARKSAGEKETITHYGPLYVAKIAVSPPQSPYNHVISMVDAKGKPFGDFVLDTDFGAIDALLSALFFGCSNLLPVDIWLVDGKKVTGYQVITTVLFTGPALEKLS